MPTPSKRQVTLTGKGVAIYIDSMAVIDRVFPKLVEIGDFVTVTTRVVILTHDATFKRQLRRIKAGRVILENGVFIGVGAVINPGVRVGKNSIVGAGSVVVSGTDIPPGEVWAGNPARKVGTFEDLRDSRMALRCISLSGRAEIKKGTFKDIAPLEVVTVKSPH